MLTISGNLDLLNSRLVKNSAGLKDSNIILAVVGNSSLDFRVPNNFKLDVYIGGSLEGWCSCSCSDDSGESSKQLHDCEIKQ